MTTVPSWERIKDLLEKLADPHDGVIQELGTDLEIILTQREKFRFTLTSVADILESKRAVFEDYLPAEDVHDLNTVTAKIREILAEYG